MRTNHTANSEHCCRDTNQLCGASPTLAYWCHTHRADSSVPSIWRELLCLFRVCVMCACLVIRRGFIKELRIHIPWTRLQSRPIEIKFKTVELIITPITHTTSHQHAGSSPWLQRGVHSRQSRCDACARSMCGGCSRYYEFVRSVSLSLKPGVVCT